MPPTQSLLTELRALPRAFWVLCAGMFVNRFGSFVYPFLTIIMHRRGFSLPEIGAAVGAFGLGGLGASLGGGWFADRFGRRNSIVFGTLAHALFTFLIYWAETLPAIVALTAIVGLMGGFYHPACSALVADLVAPAAQLRAYSALRLAANAGFAFGTAAGGFLVSHSAFWLFAGDAVTTASFGLLALFMLPHGLRHTRAEARWSEALGRLRGDRCFWALAAAQLCSALIFTQFSASYSLAVTSRGMHVAFFGIALAPEQIFGLLMGWNGALIVACELPLTRITQRFSPRPMMCLGYVLLGAGFALNALPGGFAIFFLGMTIFTLGEAIAIPLGNTWIARIAPPAMRGRYMGALSTSWSAANVIGPAIGLRLYGANPLLLWLGCGALGLAGAGILWRFSGSESREPDAPLAVEPAA